MRSFTRLHTLFATAISMTACGGTLDRSALTDDVCSGTGAFDALAGVTPATPVDYLELRDVFGMSTNPPNVVSKSGTPCATASDPATCNANLAALSTTDGWQPARGGGNAATVTVALVYTRGDEVGTITSYDALKTFLAPVDDIHDAALLVALNPDIQHRVQCGAHTAGATVGGFDVEAQTGDTCGAGSHLDDEVVFVSASGDVSVEQDVVLQQGDPNCVSGRRPAGLARGASRAGNDVGAFFAECARLEAASVVAFERMARELRAHGAPASLVAAAERAKRDEIRHARVTAVLARRHGVEPEPPVIEERGVRELFEIAIENAVEGCVRETYGALVATHQRDHATDPRVAAAMKRIARDETHHAALAWDLAAWIEGRLDDEERTEVARARREASTLLRRQLAAPVAPALADDAGLPAPSRALALFDAVAPSLWAA